MSQRLPRVSAGEMARVLVRLGFVVVRQSGSHRTYRNALEKRVTLPCHPGRILHPKVLRSVLPDGGLSIEELVSEL